MMHKMAWLGWTMLCLSMMCVSMLGCSLSEEEYAEQVEEARTCEPGDSCVLGGSAQCVCPAPINSKYLEDIQSAAEDVDCGSASVKCSSHSNVRCEAGRCVSDLP